MNLHLTELDCGLLVEGAKDFSLPEILDCGQCFTFSQLAEPYAGFDESWSGWAQGHTLTISGRKDGALLFHNISRETFENFWKSYFDLDTDYSLIKALLSQDKVLGEAVKYAPGIRVLRQDGWEALCCFIISQNNNIKRIKLIVERLCRTFGEPVGGGFYSFPSPEKLSRCTVDDLAPLKSGFRAKYLIDAAQKVSSGQVDLAAIPSMPLDEAREHLMQILGVGPKVADCALLFGFYRLECCPMDVWMKRVFAAFYPNGLPDCAKDHIGIAQQYLFHYARTCEEAAELVKSVEEPAKPKKSRKKQEALV